MAIYTRIIENLTLTSTLMLSGHEWDNTLIRNIIIQDVAGDGIMLRDVSNVMIENVTIRNVTGDGIKLSTLGSTSNVILSGNTLTNIGGDGINAGQRLSAGVDHPGLQILNNTIDTTGLNSGTSGLLHGMYIQSSDFLIQGNRILNSTDGNGISVRSSGIIRDNYIETTRESGIAYFADNMKGPSDQLIIENNTINKTGNGTLKSDINLLYVPDGQSGAVVRNFIIQNNILSDDDGQPIDIAAGYAAYGIFPKLVNNQFPSGVFVGDAKGTVYADKIVGTSGADSLSGGANDDTISGGTGDDRINGDDGNDLLSGGSGNDAYDGGAGTDTVDFSGTAAVSVNLSLTAAQFTGDGFDSFINIENVLSGDGNDSLVGNGSANVLTAGLGQDTLSGGIGNDSLYGGAGNDSLTGGTQNDRLDGGIGIDTADYTGTTAVSVNLSLTSGQDTGTGIDTLVGIENVTSGSGNDRLIGNSSGNTLISGLGDDTVKGGSGNDWLYGGAGNDSLVGGSGNDIFVFNSTLGANNVDKISDFQTGFDRIHLDNTFFQGISNGNMSATSYAANLTGLAGDGSDRVIYETDTGRLFFDADGTGAGASIHFATLRTNLALTIMDFFIL